MTTPIKPMNAVEAVNSINEGITSTVRTVVKSAMSGRPYDSQFDEQLRRAILKALASHLAYVKEKMPPEKDARIKEWSNPRDYVEDFSYRESEERSLRALAYNDAIHRSKEVIQSEIDELTK